MPQGYFNLQEAAQHLGMSVDELKQLAQRNQIRSFQDRGNLRFRIQDVEELGRRRGPTSEPELALGDAGLGAPKSAATPPSGAKKPPISPKTPAVKKDVKDAPEVFGFDFDPNADSVDLGADFPVAKGGSGSKSGKKAATPPIPTGSDSDVRLVADGSDITFSVPKDSDIKLVDSDIRTTPPRSDVQPSSGPKPSQMALDSAAKPPGAASSGTRRASPRPAAGPQPVDSGVRLVPLDSDSDVKLMGSDDVPLGEMGPSSPTDSNIRLDKVQVPEDSSEGSMHLTEEINLDEEIQKEQAKLAEQQKLPSTRLKPKSELKLPTDSPFELSEVDAPLSLADDGPKTPVQRQISGTESSDFELSSQDASAPHESSSDFDLTLAAADGTAPQDSSDFDLTPAADNSPTEHDSSDFDLAPAEDGTVLIEGDSNDFSLEPSTGDNEQVLEEQSTELTSSSSGLSLENPADEGISLEDEHSAEFDLSLEVEDTPRPSLSQPAEDSQGDFELSTGSTPRPTKLGAAVSEDSESEFDLSLDSDSQGPSLEESADDSQFELDLKGSGEGAQESDSEFELTLDDSGNLEAVSDDQPQVKSKKPKSGEAAEAEQDIFETDFEVPALGEGDDATVADSELESSDFDLALDDSELAQEEESGSQVVALDEEDAETLADTDGDAGDDVVVEEDAAVEEDSSDFADLDADVQVEEDAEVEEEEEEETEKEVVVQDRLIEPAPWGVLPVVFMLPCVIIMFLVGILGYEFVNAADGRKPPGPLTVAIGDMIGQPVTTKR